MVIDLMIFFVLGVSFGLAIALASYDLMVDVPRRRAAKLRISVQQNPAEAVDKQAA